MFIDQKSLILEVDCFGRVGIHCSSCGFTGFTPCAVIGTRLCGGCKECLELFDVPFEDLEFLEWRKDIIKAGKAIYEFSKAEFERA